MNRETFSTSRELEYFWWKESTLQTGTIRKNGIWSSCKELIDNALDACKSAGIIPKVSIRVTDGEITVSDNGPGLERRVVEAITDYTIRVVLKDAYIGPTRDAQGNALKTVLAIPYVLGGYELGQLDIISRGECHSLSVALTK